MNRFDVRQECSGRYKSWELVANIDHTGRETGGHHYRPLSLVEHEHEHEAWGDVIEVIMNDADGETRDAIRMLRRDYVDWHSGEWEATRARLLDVLGEHAVVAIHHLREDGLHKLADALIDVCEEIIEPAVVYEVRRRGYAPLADGEYEVIGLFDTIEGAEQAIESDQVERGEGMRAKYDIAQDDGRILTEEELWTAAGL